MAPLLERGLTLLPLSFHTLQTRELIFSEFVSSYLYKVNQTHSPFSFWHVSARSFDVNLTDL